MNPFEDLTNRNNEQPIQMISNENDLLVGIYSHANSIEF